MASKTGRRANAAAAAASQQTQVIKDDGSRWQVFDKETGKLVYPGSGVDKQSAVNLATGLVRPSIIRQVDA